LAPASFAETCTTRGSGLVQIPIDVERNDEHGVEVAKLVGLDDGEVLRLPGSGEAEFPSGDEVSPRLATQALEGGGKVR
jgi:hypothetical protein